MGPERPFKCHMEGCSAEYKDKKGLVRHAETCHPDNISEFGRKKMTDEERKEKLRVYARLYRARKKQEAEAQGITTSPSLSPPAATQSPPTPRDDGDPMMFVPSAERGDDEPLPFPPVRTRSDRDRTPQPPSARPRSPSDTASPPLGSFAAFAASPAPESGEASRALGRVVDSNNSSARVESHGAEDEHDAEGAAPSVGGESSIAETGGLLSRRRNGRRGLRWSEDIQDGEEEASLGGGGGGTGDLGGQLVSQQCVERTEDGQVETRVAALIGGGGPAAGSIADTGGQLVSRRCIEGPEVGQVDTRPATSIGGSGPVGGTIVDTAPMPFPRRCGTRPFQDPGAVARGMRPEDSVELRHDAVGLPRRPQVNAPAYRPNEAGWPVVDPASFAPPALQPPRQLSLSGSSKATSGAVATQHRRARIPTFVELDDMLLRGYIAGPKFLWVQEKLEEQALLNELLGRGAIVAPEYLARRDAIRSAIQDALETTP
ncbi:hypothetical protein BDK51DRAFT_35134 [Blyttiomyces helicus]|uniref:C2H2-type domain-containing protein n=1 Tax=Blyttiomyces helicus TaxID=388810 RepID=A0A4P9WRB9_9FUNG|nr:hypothetical protein BDK51DRAFT_35134 [Blyttiomyces helicus]|eukprot:RKO93790.1 hypothetical protein BDK51DRAFT_35134 [Blyttiomyces helicus]